MKYTKKEILAALRDMVSQHCQVKDDHGEYYLDSGALSDNARAMLILDAHDMIVITKRHGRRIIAQWA